MRFISDVSRALFLLLYSVFLFHTVSLFFPTVSPLPSPALARMTDPFASFAEAWDSWTASVAASIDGFFRSRNRANDEESRRQRASVTGIISERSAGLTALPSYAHDADVARRARVLDAGLNAIAALDERIGALVGLERARLDGNRLERLPPAFCSLTRIRTLDLRGNVLRELPKDIGSLCELEELVVDDNALECLPASLGSCSKLRRLSASGNEMRSFDEGAAALGSCAELEYISFARNKNMRGALPVSWSALKKLREVDVDETSVESVPSAILEHCVSLRTISARACVSFDVTAFKTTPGYDAYERRRRSKHTKQLDARVLMDTSRFDERLG